MFKKLGSLESLSPLMVSIGLHGLIIALGPWLGPRREQETALLEVSLMNRDHPTSKIPPIPQISQILSAPQIPETPQIPSAPQILETSLTPSGESDLILLGDARPPYPILSRTLQEEGEVQIKLQINNEGGVISVELERSSGHPRLDRSAIEFYRQARFQMQGKPLQEGNLLLHSTRAPLFKSLQIDFRLVDI